MVSEFLRKHARIQKVLSEGVQIWTHFLLLFFLVEGGIEDPNTAINGPSSVRQRNGVFRWQADGGPSNIECWLGS